jgi:hypothetical protein
VRFQVSAAVAARRAVQVRAAARAGEVPVAVAPGAEAVVRAEVEAVVGADDKTSGFGFRFRVTRRDDTWQVMDGGFK